MTTDNEACIDAVSPPPAASRALEALAHLAHRIAGGWEDLVGLKRGRLVLARRCSHCGGPAATESINGAPLCDIHRYLVKGGDPGLTLKEILTRCEAGIDPAQGPNAGAALVGEAGTGRSVLADDVLVFSLLGSMSDAEEEVLRAAIAETMGRQRPTVADIVGTLEAQADRNVGGGAPRNRSAVLGRDLARRLHAVVSQTAIGQARLGVPVVAVDETGPLGGTEPGSGPR